jgi:dGTPase
VLGEGGSERIDTLVHDLVEQSEAAGDIVQGERVGEAMRSLRTFMFERVYLGEQARAEHAKIARVIRTLFEHYCLHPAELPPSSAGGPLSVRVTDYLAGMTDRFCLRAFEDLAVPKGFL